MPGYLISPKDLTSLDNHIRVLQKLPEFTRSFKVNLDAVPVREYGAYRIPEIAELLKQAQQHVSLWSQTLPAIKTFHKELLVFIEDIIQSSALIENSAGVTPDFVERTHNGLRSFTDTLDQHLKKLETLTQGIYKTLPRISDFLNNNIYRHAHTYNLIKKNPDQSIAIQNLTASLSFAETGPALSPQARLKGALYYLQTTRGQYAEAYCAASNINSHLSRVSDLLAFSFSQSIKMRIKRAASRPYLELRVMLVSLKEIQHLSHGLDIQSEQHT